MSPSTDHVLFQPLSIGQLQLAHRMVMAPMTRCRADRNHVPGDLIVEYYSQRASVPGTLLITEATIISEQAGGVEYAPGIYTADHVTAWKRVTDAVHAKGSFIYLQLWAIGFPASSSQRPRKHPLITIPPKRADTESALTVAEIQEYVQDFALAAKNATEAGFDGVEVHGANGFLIDQFLQDFSNSRTDEYGGSIERRSRFGLEVVKAVVDVVGQDRTGIRLSPWGNNTGIRMDDPIPQFSHFICMLRSEFPDLAYLHLLEPPIVNDVRLAGSNDIFRELWAPRPYLSAHVHAPEDALQLSEQSGDAIVFGRWFVSNPDLPRRIKAGIPLAPFDYITFYGPQSAKGYTDYPAADAVDEQHESMQQDSFCKDYASRNKPRDTVPLARF